jgi:DNA (cytosine-5)-methyltransferase 1
VKTSQPVAVDLFCGAGGLSLGFEMAGFRIAQAIEQETRAAKSYALNHPETDVISGDVAKLRPSSCLKRLAVTPGSITAVIGGPPCQGFSESNRRTRSLKNPRNHLYKSFISFVREIGPQWVVIENVAGMLTLEKGVFHNRILRALNKAGYSAQSYLLNAAHFGVPQVRRRLFIIGRLNGDRLPTFITTHGREPHLRPFVTVRDAIADLPVLRNGAGEDAKPYRAAPSQYGESLRRSAFDERTLSAVTGNLVTRNGPRIVARYAQIPQGGNWEDIPARLMGSYADPTRCHTGIYHRLQWDEPSKVVGNFRKNMVVHPSQHRGLSVREAARLQSFPDRYLFTGSIGFQQQQVADAVPPLLACVVATEILKCERA